MKVRVQTLPCPGCHKNHYVEMSVTEYEALMQGAFVQVAAPSLTDEQREMFISGYCPPCWERDIEEPWSDE